jgi:hypothetical protein
MMISGTRVRRLSAALLATAALAFAAPTFAQEISESHIRAARAAISSIMATDQFDLILPQAAGALKGELIRKDPNLQQIISAAVDQKSLELAGRRADLEREAALAYARVFTEAELNEIAAFYTTTAGKKLISEGPIVTREVLKAAEIWQTGIGRDLAESVAKEIESKVAVGVPASDPASPVITPEGANANQ